MPSISQSKNGQAAVNIHHSYDGLNVYTFLTAFLLCTVMG